MMVRSSNLERPGAPWVRTDHRVERVRALRAAWIVTAALGTAACAAEEEDSWGAGHVFACQPGTPVACMCADMSWSEQMCLADNVVSLCACDGAGGPLQSSPGADGGLAMPPPPPPPGSDAASLGEACLTPTDGADYLVVRFAPGGCDSDTAALEGSPADALTVRIPADVRPGVGVSFSAPGRHCLAGVCQDVTALVTLDDYTPGAPTNGRWEATLQDGRAVGNSFGAEVCMHGGSLQCLDQEPIASGNLAAGVTLSRVALYQGVEVPWMEGGAGASPGHASVTANRDAWLRVFFTPSQGFTPRDVAFRAVVGGPSGERVLEVIRPVAMGSTQGSFESTANLLLPADAVAVGMTLAVEVVELIEDTTYDGSTAQARFPLQGQAPVTVKNVGPIRIKIVPMRYTADGSDRTPDVSPGRLKLIREALEAVYPSSEVILTAREPVEWNATWNQLSFGPMLQTVTSVRQSDGAPPDEYYYGMIQPADTLGAYCLLACVMGLGNVPPAGDALNRVGVGVGFDEGTDLNSDSGIETAVHEIGHALGLPHAPCGGAAGADPGYPYAGGGIGSWGFDARKRRLYDPAQHTDVMGYCDSRWISDYNYDLIAERAAYVNGSPLWRGAERQQWRSIMWAGQQLSWGLEFHTDTPPGGSVQLADVLAADGTWLQQVELFRYPYAHSDQGMWLVPEPGPGWHTLVVDGQHLPIPEHSPTSVGGAQ